MTSNTDADARRRSRRAVLGTLLVVVCAACNPARGCASSTFHLAPESRLPKWFTLPTGSDRSKVDVVVTYYGPWLRPQRTANFVMVDFNDNKLAEVDGDKQGMFPLSLKPQPADQPSQYPLYEIITVNGIQEVIEHRKMEPCFYITDDPEVKAALIATYAGQK